MRLLRREFLKALAGVLAGSALLRWRPEQAREGDGQPAEWDCDWYFRPTESPLCQNPGGAVGELYPPCAPDCKFRSPKTRGSDSKRFDSDRPQYHISIWQPPEKC